MEESFWPNKCQKIEFGKFSREQPRKSWNESIRINVELKISKELSKYRNTWILFI